MSEVWVLRDSEGNYVSANRCFTLTNEGWLYRTFTGRTIGFSYYTNKLTAKRELEDLRKINDKYDLKKKFNLEYIEINDIPTGEINIEKLTNIKELNFCAK